MPNLYRIEFYREKSKYNPELYNDKEFLETIRVEFELMEQIKLKIPNIEIKEVFSDFNILDNEKIEDLEKIDDYYTNIIVKAATASKVPVSRVYRSYSKKYKINNFMVIFKNGAPYQTFPYKKGKRIYSVTYGLEQMLKEDYDIKKMKDSVDRSDYKFTERDLQKLLATYPHLIEDNLTYIDLEVDVEGGSIDCVFRDKDDMYLIIETKLKASDQLTGQILRYANTFMKNYQQDAIRKGIACVEIDRKRIETFKELGIETFKINIEKY